MRVTFIFNNRRAHTQFAVQFTYFQLQRKAGAPALTEERTECCIPGRPPLPCLASISSEGAPHQGVPRPPDHASNSCGCC